MVTQQEHDEATERGKQVLRTEPRALSARFDPAAHRIMIDLNTGYSISFDPRRAQGLETATPKQLETIEISFPGFGVHFPEVDADLWVPSLARGIFGSKRWEAAWLAAHPLENNPPLPELSQSDQSAQEATHAA